MRPHTLTSYDTVEVIVRARIGGLTWGETAELIGVDERTLHYWRAKGKSLWVKIYTLEMQETELTERERWLVDLYERLNRPSGDDPDAISISLRLGSTRNKPNWIIEKPTASRNAANGANTNGDGAKRRRNLTSTH